MATLNPPVKLSTVSYSSPDIKPLPLGPAALFFAIPSLVILIAYHWGINAMARLGVNDFAAYMLATMIPLAAVLIAALVAYRLEGHPLTWPALANRFRLRRMTGKDWLWAIGGFLFTLIGFPLWELSRTLISRWSIPLPAALSPALSPALQTVSDYREVMGPGAIGNWGFVGLIVGVLFFNVIGEELYFRGYILPRQELAHGRRAWMIHFVL